MQCRYNNDNPNNNYCDPVNDIINTLVQHEGCLINKYTPTNIKKQRTVLIISG